MTKLRLKYYQELSQATTKKEKQIAQDFAIFFLLLNVIIKNIHIFEATQKFSSRLPADPKMKLCLKIKVIEHPFKVGNSNYFYK